MLTRSWQALASPVWPALAWQDIVSRYRRSTLGAFWITVTTSVFVVSVGAVYSGLFADNTASYMLYLGTGFIFWQFIASTLNEGATVMIGGREMLLNTRVEPMTLVLRLIARNTMTLAHNLPVYIALAIFAHPGSWQGLPYAIPGILALLANALWLALLIAIAGVRFRDVPPIVTSLTQLLFLLTPIFWQADAVSGRRAQFTDLNPFTHILAAVREPLIGHPAPLSSLAISAAFAVAGLGITLFLYAAVSQRLRYWL